MGEGKECHYRRQCTGRHQNPRERIESEGEAAEQTGSEKHDDGEELQEQGKPNPAAIVHAPTLVDVDDRLAVRRTRRNGSCLYSEPVISVVANLVRGALIGVAEVIPGVSGGTIALIVGIYEALIDQVRAGAKALGMLVRGNLRGFWKQVRGLDVTFLLPLAIGILLAVGGLASVLETQLEENPEEMAGLFFGLVAASVLIGWDLISARTSAHLAVVLLVAVAIFFGLGFQSGPITDPSPVVLVGAGALAICAMILPGISGSFILLMIGMYAAVIGAVDDRAFGDLALVGIGAVVGLALFSTLLGWLLDHHGDTVMAAMVGLMLGSLRVLWPWPNGVGVISEDESEVIDGTGLELPAGDELLGPVALGMIGFVIVMVLAQIGKRLER